MGLMLKNILPRLIIAPLKLFWLHEEIEQNAVSNHESHLAMIREINDLSAEIRLLKARMSRVENRMLDTELP